jgi:UbiD family decarboxylase
MTYNTIQETQEYRRIAVTDLRVWLSKVDELEELKVIEGADWDQEIGCITDLNIPKRDGFALLFDNIKGYPPGFRVLTCSTTTPRRVALTFDLPLTTSDYELLEVFRQKLQDWDSDLQEYSPKFVDEGPVLDNVLSGTEVDLFKFPVPKWHDEDGGRYIGTGNAVITQDSESGEINLGTYRMVVHDTKTAGLNIIPGQHAREHIRKYHARGEPCPIAVSLGHHPLILRIACREVPSGSEYNYIGAIQKTPVKVIREEITGLPIPADSEIVLAGFCPPGKMIEEGPFGEFVGYYASKRAPAPIIEVERIYYRKDPILLGSPPGRIGDSGYYMVLVGSAMLYNELVKYGIPGVKGVWLNEVGKQMFTTISLQQMYPGHVKQVAMFAHQSRIVGNLGRYVVVVDDDIDPTNVLDVIWALATRSDPVNDIDIIRRAKGNPLDPMIPKNADTYFNSRAIIDACIPFERMKDFPEKIALRPDLVEQVKDKWGAILNL